MNLDAPILEPMAARVDVTVGTGRKVDVQNGVLRVGSSDGMKIGYDPILVGRNPGCGICIPERHVSAAHAELVATPSGVRVRDLGSRNGTWIGGARIVEAFLVEPERIMFGDVEAHFEVGDKQSIALPVSNRFHDLYGKNAMMRLLFTRLATLAPTDLTVLIEGETGTGKELVARSLHEASKRKKKPFIVIDCGAIAPGLAESLLFGHERGAFTGAIGTRVSPFVQAKGGTIFLDELGELPLDVQPKLLRALAERRVKPVGGDKYLPFDVRVVAATRRDLVSAVNDGSFRSDLYFRIAQARVSVPPLRQRADDIPELVRELLVAQGTRSDAVTRVPRDSMLRLLRHDWPGNVRELRNAISAALAFSTEGGPIDVAAHVSDVQGTLTPGSAETSYHVAKKEALARFERGFFSLLVAETGGSVVEIARRADLERAHVRRYLKAHGLLLPRSERRKT